MDVNHLNNLNKVLEQVSINEAYDKEIARLNANRNSYAQYKKAKDAQKREEKKKRNPGEY